MEVFKITKANMVVYIHPSKAADPTQAIYHELSLMLFKFNEVFDGVVLAYGKIGVQSADAKILPGIHPYFGIRLKAELLLFSPKPGMLLEGKVVKLGKESIHVIVLGFCFASINDEDIHKEFRYKTKHGEEVYSSKSHTRHVIKVGSMIRFLSKSMDEETLYISGSLLSSNTGSIKWLSHHMEEGPESERSNKKRKMENQMEMQVLDDVALLNNDRQSKKSKRRQSGEES